MRLHRQAESTRRSRIANPQLPIDRRQQIVIRLQTVRGPLRRSLHRRRTRKSAALHPVHSAKPSHQSHCCRGSRPRRRPHHPRTRRLLPSIVRPRLRSRAPFRPNPALLPKASNRQRNPLRLRRARGTTRQVCRNPRRILPQHQSRKLLIRQVNFRIRIQGVPPSFRRTAFTARCRCVFTVLICIPVACEISCKSISSRNRIRKTLR